MVTPSKMLVTVLAAFDTRHDYAAIGIELTAIPINIAGIVDCHPMISNRLHRNAQRGSRTKYY
jgi:hypothetical protein